MQTPYFVIEKDALEENFRYLSKSLEYEWPNYLIGYSYKTNSLPWLINYFNSLGCYAEVVSDDEYKLAVHSGVNKSRIIYNGVSKAKNTFLEAIENKAVVNIDSEYEIDWLDDLPKGQYEVGIRVNFDLDSICPGQTQCGEEGERFGFCYENGELEGAIKRITQKGIRVVGLHLHKSSRTRSVDIYRAISIMAVKIAEEYDLDLSYIDIGGGFFGGLASKPQYPEYFSVIANILRKRFSDKKTKIIVEPGMALVGAFVSYVSTVLDVKRTTRNFFVVTDGSRIHIDPLMTKNSYSFSIVKHSETKDVRTIDTQVITDFTCMEHDRLFVLKNAHELTPGDAIVYYRVGAYTMTLSPLFIKWAPEVYINEKGKMTRVRKHLETEDFVQINFEEGLL